MQGASPNGARVPLSLQSRMSSPLGAFMGRRLLGEFIGTALLVTAVVGSGIAAAHLSPNDAGLELLENAAATAAALVAIILAIGPVSGAHLNPVVTLADRFFGGLGSKQAVGYIAAQFAGGACGAVIANVMFSMPALELSTKARSSGGLWLAEVVATFGLLLVIFGVVRSGRGSAAPFAVGAYIGAAYFFTASTSFANPAVTAARMFSNSFAGIRASSVPAFIAAQLIGAALAVAAIRVLYPGIAEVAADVLVPHEPGPGPHGQGSHLPGTAVPASSTSSAASAASRPGDEAEKLGDFRSDTARFSPDFAGRTGSLPSNGPPGLLDGTAPSLGGDRRRGAGDRGLSAARERLATNKEAW